MQQQKENSWAVSDGWSLQRSPDPLASGEGLAAPSQAPHPHFSPQAAALQPC